MLTPAYAIMAERRAFRVISRPSDFWSHLSAKTNISLPIQWRAKIECHPLPPSSACVSNAIALRSMLNTMHTVDPRESYGAHQDAGTAGAEGRWPNSQTRAEAGRSVLPYARPWAVPRRRLQARGLSLRMDRGWQALRQGSTAASLVRRPHQGTPRRRRPDRSEQRHVPVRIASHHQDPARARAPTSRPRRGRGLNPQALKGAPTALVLTRRFFSSWTKFSTCLVILYPPIGVGAGDPSTYRPSKIGIA
jgi:hypothetical protein